MAHGISAGRRRVIGMAAGLVVPAVLSACAGGLSGAGPAAVVTADSLVQVNAFRAQNGRPPLAASPVAGRAALEQARRMAENGAMKHAVGWRGGFAGRMRRAGVALPAAENIAAGQPTLERALAAWEASPGHRRNILEDSFAGYGLAYADDRPGGTRYWAMVLTAAP